MNIVLNWDELKTKEQIETQLEELTEQLEWTKKWLEHFYPGHYEGKVEIDWYDWRYKPIDADAFMSAIKGLEVAIEELKEKLKGFTDEEDK